MIAHGWAVVDNGEIDTKTVSAGPLAAMVNWILVKKGVMATGLWSDNDVEKEWQRLRGKAELVEVDISVARRP
jgi:hypothetical protein